jgi:gas vesicle protein
MNTKNIIFGSLALVILGGGAYLFLKNKKSKDTLKLEDLKKLGDSVTQTGSATTTPDKVLDSAPVTNTQAQETSKQIQAQALATQIWTLKSEFASLQGARPYCKPSILGMGSASEYEKCSKNYTRIIDIQNRIKDLGYKEDNGLAVKI